MIALIATTLLGCSGNGSGSVTSEVDAPWSMDEAVVFLFTPGADNNGRSGMGVLAISTDPSHGCKDVRSGPPAGGSGLWFTVQYDTGRSEGAASPAWDGLYATGDVTSVDEKASRGLTVSGWHQGFVYGFEGADSWLSVTHGSQNRFQGRFATRWWSGEFDAEYCPKSDFEPASSPADSDDTGTEGD